MKTERKISADSPQKQPTKRQAEEKKSQMLEVKSGYLLVKGEKKLRIDEDGCVNMSLELMGDIDVESIPEDVTIRLVLERCPVYPMWCFQAIEISRDEKEGVSVCLHTQSHREIWSDPLNVDAWIAIMEAACTLEFIGGFKSPTIFSRGEEGDLFFNASIPVTGRTINEVTDRAMRDMLKIEQRARAIHFVVAEENNVFARL